MTTLRTYRLLRGFTHAEVARCIGYHPESYRKLESGKRLPLPVTEAKLRGALGIPDGVRIETRARGRPKRARSPRPVCIP